ncbi:aminomethyltransferase family protein [Microbacterium kribbense]|uniref:Aminomethyltransferase family protein n=1 Tax=Microbacterium kribbense TaxID=433645 RepID=A0ABP7GTJ1_9MICO
MLRSAPALKFPFLYPPEYSSWPDEQRAWKTTSVLFDQSHHMADIHVKGPDVRRLFSDVGVNSMAAFGRNRAKQFVACNPDGLFIGDGILFGLEDDEYSLVGGPLAFNWVSYQAETGGYDVEVTKDPPTAFNPGKRQMYRYELNGPRSREILEKAQGGPLPQIGFFHMDDLTIAGRRVRALNHTMAGAPGMENTGLELMGPIDDGPAVLDAIIAAGQEFGLRRGGSRAYLTTARESGWIPLIVPAIYTGEQMKPYREWLNPRGLEGQASLQGSYDSDDIEDYYATPWDLGYGNLIRFDHDFIGRDALQRRTDEPHRRKVWLVWNSDDVLGVIEHSLFGQGLQPAILDLPNAEYGTLVFDKVLVDDRVVGLSTWGGYTANARRFMSLAMIDEAVAQEGAAVSLVWGQADGGEGMPFQVPHLPAEIRATVSLQPPD